MPPAPSATTPPQDPSLTAIVERTMALAERRQLSLDRVVGSFEQTGFAALMLVPALAVVTPLSGIPLFSSVCGLTIALVAVQWLFGRKSLWLPTWLRRRKLDGATVRKAMSGILPLARWLDRHSRKRARFVFRQPLRLLLPATCLAFGMLMPVLELVPFSSSFLGAATCLVAFSVMTRDGLFALAALVPAGAVIWGVLALLN